MRLLQCVLFSWEKRLVQQQRSEKQGSFKHKAAVTPSCDTLFHSLVKIRNVNETISNKPPKVKQQESASRPILLTTVQFAHKRFTSQAWERLKCPCSPTSSCQTLSNQRDAPWSGEDPPTAGPWALLQVCTADCTAGFDCGSACLKLCLPMHAVSHLSHLYV